MAEIGRMIGGRYRLMELLGEGDVATVYRANDVELNRDVAVKLLRPEYGRNADFVSQFRQTVRAAAGLSHSNVVSIYDFGTDAAGTYVVTEYVDGDDLGSLLRRHGPMPARRAAMTTAGVARALEAAHARGLVHSDIRPAHVMITQDGRVKVTDFGVSLALVEAKAESKPAESTPGEPADDSLAESAGYSTPEQGAGGPDQTGDVYALGVLLFELLTGRRPWEGDTAEAVTAARAANPMPRPSQFRYGIPSAIEAIVVKAISPEPEDRYASAAAMAGALEVFLAVSGSPAGAAASGDTAASAGKGAAAAAGLGVAGVAAAAGLAGAAGAGAGSAAGAAGVAGAAGAGAAAGVGATGAMDAASGHVPFGAAGGVVRPNAAGHVNYTPDAYASGPIPPDSSSPDAVRRAGRRAQLAEPEPEEPAPSPWLWVAGLLALLMVTIVGLIIFLLINQKGSTPVYAPNLVNVTLAQAQQMASSNGLTLVQATQTNNGSQTDNTVIAQDPPAGTAMHRGDAITVTVIVPSGLIAVPNLVGRTEDEARFAIISANLTSGTRSEQYDPTIPAGQVISTNPKAGAMVAKSFVVDYVVSKGPEPTPSPSPSPSPPVPVKPTGVTATGGNASAIVSWTAPASNGAAITGYAVTSKPGNLTCTTTGALTCTVSGLTNGTSYTFTVVATNAAGDGASSDASNAVTPASVPSKPTGVTATGGNASAIVSWTAPASNGAAITGYAVTSNPDNLTCTTTGALSCTVSGLTNGTSYKFTVVASNAAGDGAPSAASTAVTPASVPSKPTGVTATGGNASASVSWTAPASNGSAITGYIVTSKPDNFTCTTTGALSCTVSGLTNGTSYKFTVVATNAVGDSAPSDPSNAVTPAP